MFFNLLVVLLISFPLTVHSSFDEQKVLSRLHSRLGSSPSFAKLSTGAKLNAVLKELEVENLGSDDDLSKPAGDEESKSLLSSNADLAFQCYDATVGKNESANLFQLSKGQVVKVFFSFHLYVIEDSSISTLFKRIRGLLESIATIARHVIDCIKEAKSSNAPPTKLGLTPMSAYSSEEFQRLLLAPIDSSKLSTSASADISDKPPFVFGFCNTSFFNETGDIMNPVEFDYRDVTAIKGANYTSVGPVKFQGRCGSCFVFGAVASLESGFMRSTQNNRPNQTLFSEQALLDCSPPGGCNNSAADGSSGKGQRLGFGRPEYTFDIAAEIGLLEKWRVPYEFAQHNDRCDRQYADNPVVAKSSGLCYLHAYSSGDLIEAAINRFGVATAQIFADHAMQHLKGPWNRQCTNSTANHIVAIIGYTPDYYIVRNSWGPLWGIDGYLYILKSSAPSCGLDGAIYWPTFEGGQVTSKDIIPVHPVTTTTTTTSATNEDYGDGDDDDDDDDDDDE